MTHVTNETEGRTVLLLSPYCNLNPTELIWSQVGGNNASFKLQEVRSLLETAVQNKWQESGQIVYSLQ
jgi:hypothetical protein